jgi:hypothetical protein
MSLFIEFKKLLAEYGLEYFNKYYGVYKGFVEANEDPEFRGRLKLKVPQIYGDSTLDYWSESKGMFSGAGIGFFAIPNIGDGVWVSFENGDPRYPIWEYGAFEANQVPSAAKNNGMKPTNFIIQTGGNRIEMDEKNEWVLITNKAGRILKIDKDGAIIGKGDEPAVLGDKYADLTKNILEKLVAAKVSTALGPMPLLNAAEFQSLINSIDGTKSKTVKIES